MTAVIYVGITGGWVLMTVLIGRRQLHAGDTIGRRIGAFAVAFLLWPVIWIAEGADDPQQMSDAFDDDHPPGL